MNINKVKLTLLLSSIFLFTTCYTKRQTNGVLDHEYWKTQAVTDILPFWSQHAADSANGTFYCSMDSNWNPTGENIKFPSMLSRHLFSYAAAYLMSGNDEYLHIANQIKQYLLRYAWDKQYGGWYNTLSSSGVPMLVDKSTFVQVYVITGLTMYYLVTHDSEVLNYINKSNDLLEAKAWDHTLGGYFDALDQDWSVSSQVKSLSSQLAPVSGYLIYLYLGTHNPEYLKQAERISATIMMHMKDSQTGWVLESFDQNWNEQPLHLEGEEINIGHNIEIAWSMVRLYLLNGKQDYLRAGSILADRIHQYGLNADKGFWYATTGNQNPGVHSNYTYWWIQAYGNMFDLYLNRLYPDKNYLNHFKKGAICWDSFFLDKKQGDTFLSVFENGNVKEGMKANRYKASYHSLEHCLLNYLYLGCWVNHEPITLYFKITSCGAGEVLYPIPIEIEDARITGIRINQQDYLNPASNKSFIILPELQDAVIAVTIIYPGTR